MNGIGGFFELELKKSKEYHSGAIKLNTARNALEYILRANDYKKVYLPFFICDSVLEPIKKLNIDMEFYHIDIGWNIQLDRRRLKKDELLLYVNYFGVNDNKVREIIDEKTYINFNLCIDNSQSFFLKPIEEIDTLYSARKFFGVPSGAYLYTSKDLSSVLGNDQSYEQCSHLLKRIDLSSSLAYEEYKKNDDSLKNQPLQYMSKLSERILKSIDYEEIKRKRLENFYYLDNYLSSTNDLSLQYTTITCPMVYPYFHPNGNELREYLISQGIYIAQYWPNVLKKMQSDTFEYELAENLVAIPLDQRYGKIEMRYICEKINQFKK